MMAYDTQPYVYGEIPAEASNTGPNRRSRVNDLKSWFEEAGWTITDKGYRVNVTTTLPILVPSHTFCDLGLVPDADLLFVLNIDDTAATHFVIDDDDSCFSGATPRTILDVDLANISYSLVEIGVDPVSDNNLKAILGLDTYSNTELTHEIIWKYIGKLLSDRVGGSNVTKLPTTNVGTTYTTAFELVHDSDIDWNFTIGGFLSTTVSSIEGYGFVAASADNVITDNRMELYVYYEQVTETDPFSNQIGFRTRLGSFFTDDSDKHPLSIVDEEEGVTVNTYGGLTTIHDLVGFIGPYFFFIETPSLVAVGKEVRVMGGTFRIKALDGEIIPDTKKIIILAASLRFDTVDLHVFRNRVDSRFINMAFWFNNDTTGDKTGIGSWVLFLGGFRFSRNDTNWKDGIDWVGDIAYIAEPWIGWNVYLASGVTNNLEVPLFCTIPDAIVPYRAITLGNPVSPSECFTWDSKLWRYYQSDRFPIGGIENVQGASMALRVPDTRAYNGSGYTGIPFYEIDSLSLSPTELSSGSTATLTINVADAQDKTLGGNCIVRVNNERVQIQGSPDHLVVFAPDATSATVVLTDNDLEVEEVVKIQVIGKDDVITELNFLALAV